MKTYFPYGPPIGHTILPDELVSDFNKGCDDIVKDKELTKKQDFSHALVGEVEQELLLSADVMNKWGNWFGKQVREYVAAYFNQLTIPNQNIFSVPMKEAQQAVNNLQINVQAAWYIRSFTGDYNPLHTHGGCELSCVGFLKVPDLSNERKKGRSNNGVLEILGSAGSNDLTFFENDRIGFTPKVGNWYLFPANLRHLVYPFKADGERRSFSINMSTDMFKRPSEK